MQSFLRRGKGAHNGIFCRDRRGLDEPCQPGFGPLAWMLPVAAMIRTAARPRALHPALPLVCVSFAACAAALYLQLRYHAHLSRIEDVGAFLDTAQAAAFASAVLLCVTLAVNALALCAAAVCARKAADRA